MTIVNVSLLAIDKVADLWQVATVVREKEKHDAPAPAPLAQPTSATTKKSHCDQAKEVKLEVSSSEAISLMTESLTEWK